MKRWVAGVAMCASLLAGVGCGAAPERPAADVVAPTLSKEGAGSSAMPFEKPSDAELRQRLTPLQYEVTQRDGTERPFDNPYCNEKRPGLYVDIVSGEPLFSSREKFDSGTGWPSFWQPLAPEGVVTRTDRKLFMRRTEVRSARVDSHLGHVFDDGPAPTGLRYCINSASLRFVPLERMEAEGYGAYRAHVEGPAAP